jgi:hypothetical protein
MSQAPATHVVRPSNHALPRPKPSPQRSFSFAPPPLLVRSLANRVFGPAAPADDAVEWVQLHVEALALVGVELPAMLPFLRIVAADKRASLAEEPLAILREMLFGAGILPEAWKRLPRWGFDTFRGLGGAPAAPVRIARFANLLFRLGVTGPPPRHFAMYGFALALHRAPPHAGFDLERHPLWFLRALLRAVEAVTGPEGHTALRADLRTCLDWLDDARPEPDSNQQHAGWPWILQQARAHRKAKRRTWTVPWAVPCREWVMERFRVVPIRCAAELAEEAEAMENCLEDYEDDCRSGNFAVFSVRDQLTDERLACFSIEREAPGEMWEVSQVAGPKNARVEDRIELAARILALGLGRAGGIQ